MRPIRIIPLGTSSGVPTRKRNVSSLALQLESRQGTRWFLFDCGEGTQHRILETPLRPGALEAIFVTHLHGDHLFGLPGLLSTLGMQNRDRPLSVYGPRGLREFLSCALGVSSAHSDYPLEITEAEEGVLHTGPGYRVECLHLEHRVETFGYRFVEADHPGRLDVDKAASHGVPAGPLLGRLQRGEDVLLPDGRAIRSQDVLAPARRGRSVSYCTDTVPCEAAVRLSREADLLIHESTYAHDLVQMARERGHSTARDAAHVAREAGAKRLLLTHFSPRYTDPGPLLAEARAIFQATEAAADLVEVML